MRHALELVVSGIALTLLSLFAATLEHQAQVNAEGTVPVQTSSSCRPVQGMASVPAGQVLLGEDDSHAPGIIKQVSAFAIDRTEVTNAQFSAFVTATGYITMAERDGGGAVFSPPAQLDQTKGAEQWWRFVKGANWRHPTGPGSQAVSTAPVVQVTRADALAYAHWLGHDLPTEAQWERAARGSQTNPRAIITWAYDQRGIPKANTWQGPFPILNTHQDGYVGLAPVGCFKPNDLGLYDMIGNAWEWTRDEVTQGQGLVKGGSYLCAMNYCASYRPAARQAQELDLPTSHIGFRTVVNTAGVTTAERSQHGR